MAKRKRGVRTFFTNRSAGNMGLAQNESAFFNILLLGGENLIDFGEDSPTGNGFSPRLVHGDDILVIGGGDRETYSGVGIVSESNIPADAVITDLPGFPIFFPCADCFLVALYDEEKSVLGAFHSGRKGTLLNIAERTVQKMEAEFGCKPIDICAYVFPGICGRCYKLEYFPKIPKEYQAIVLSGLGDGRSLDLRAIILYQLVQSGIGRILFPEGEEECTCCTQNGDGPKYFSHFGFSKGLAGHETPGRNALVAEIVEVEENRNE